MPGCTILVIDGDPASRNFIATSLQKEGHSVAQAGSGKEGLIFAWRDRPEIIIVEPALADLPGEDLAARLRADPRTARVPLIAFSRDASPARKKACEAAGYHEYIVKGPQALPALLSTVGMIATGEQHAAREGGLLIVFLSAKGGSGTSSLCANLGRGIADQLPEAQVVVADLVLPIGSIAGVVGYRQDQGLVSVAALPGTETTPDFLRHRLPRLDDWRFHLLAGSPDPQRSTDLVVGRIAELVRGLKFAYDFVLLDIGRALSRISVPLIEHADLIVMVVGADISTVDLTRTTWDYLQTKGVLPGSVFPILNRAVGLEGLTKAEIEQKLGLPVRTSIPYLGGNLSMANNQHLPYAQKFPGDSASIALKDTARMIVEAARRSRAG